MPKRQRDASKVPDKERQRICSRFSIWGASFENVAKEHDLHPDTVRLILRQEWDRRRRG